MLLANKLDGDISLHYTTVAAPLIFSHMTLIFMSFGAKGGNKCKESHLISFTLGTCLSFFLELITNSKNGFFTGWFGIRKDFCHFLLSLCPLLQEYGNISYQSRNEQDQPPSEPMVSEKGEKHIKKIDLTKPVVPIVSIDMPD